MKKLISFTVFVVIILTMAALNAAQAQRIVIRPTPVAIAAAVPGYCGGGYRYHRMIRPMPLRVQAFYGRPRFYRRPGLRMRAW
jgi:hypothetical protein